MIRQTLGLGLLLLSFACAQADSVHGVWQTEPGESGGVLHVELADCENKICGTIIKAINKDGDIGTDYEHLGKKMLWDMQAEEDDFYSDGKIWAPDKDKTYTSKMQLDGDILIVKGCIVGGLLCRGQDWSRVAGE